jgi:ClpP class serine protease
MAAGAWGPVPSGRYECPDCAAIVKEADLPPYEIVRQIAILPLDGPLFPRANLMTRYSGATSYEEFGQLFSHAMMNDDVAAALILADSPGGSCLGMAEACSLIYTARESGEKRILGMISPMAASAAYGIVSQCEDVGITESAMAGSIGTILSYSNWERAERNEGNDRVTLMSSELKSIGVPQTVAQVQSLQETLDAYYEQFKSIVKRGRPDLEMSRVANGKTWVGSDAVKMGIADRVTTFERMINEYGG